MSRASDRIVYLDNAATSWPKAPGVAEAMARVLDEGLANPGRGGHSLAVAGSRLVLATRRELAALLGFGHPLRLVFTPNVTHATNLVLWGWLRPGDRVVTTSVEHNAVVRPLRALERERRIAVTVVPGDAAGRVSLEAFADALAPAPALAVVNHAGNVSGALQPLAEIAALCRDRGVPLLVDTAQTAGNLPIAVDALGIDLLAFTGHKGLLGPPGTGGLCIAPTVDTERLRPLVHGGTGSRSEDEAQPDFLPDRYEAGTLNAVGLAGLLAAVRYLRRETVERVREHEQRLTRALLSALAGLPEVTVYGPRDAGEQVAVVSFTVAGTDNAEVARRLDEEHGIMVRAGLHCSPAAHRALGTFPEGTVRLGLGYFNTLAQVEAAVGAVAAIAAAPRAQVSQR